MLPQRIVSGPSALTILLIFFSLYVYFRYHTRRYGNCVQPELVVHICLLLFSVAIFVFSLIPSGSTSARVQLEGLKCVNFAVMVCRMHSLSGNYVLLTCSVYEHPSHFMEDGQEIYLPHNHCIGSPRGCLQ